MQYQKIDDCYLLRIDQGELVHATIHQFCNEHDIKNAWFQGLGAAEFLRCGPYDLATREYRFTEYDELVEVVSYAGNVMQKDDQPMIHAHGVFSDAGNSTFGGHVDEMRVGIVLEVVLTLLRGTIKRLYDEATGLYLMDLEHKSIK